jgi:hypothetical protein
MLFLILEVSGATIVCGLAAFARLPSVGYANDLNDNSRSNPRLLGTNNWIEIAENNISSFNCYHLISPLANRVSYSSRLDK